MEGKERRVEQLEQESSGLRQQLEASSRELEQQQQQLQLQLSRVQMENVKQLAGARREKENIDKVGEYF